jgi:hypothetical protein
MRRRRRRRWFYNTGRHRNAHADTASDINGESDRVHVSDK